MTAQVSTIYSQRKLNVGQAGKFLGILLMLLSAFMLPSVGWSLYYEEKFTIIPISLTIILTLAAGTILFVTNKKENEQNISIKEGYLIVCLSWILMAFTGALPFYLSNVIPSFTDAFFESMSGFTTTGASILEDIEAVPKSMLFWRSMTHWLGGMGIIVLTVAILPILGIGGMQLFAAEAPGTTPARLHPQIRSTAKRLWGIYIFLTILQTFLLMLGGMDLFESLNHSFSTMATGGFSTQNDSIAGYSAFIQYVIILFMILAGTSFVLHYFILKGILSKVRQNDEFRFYILVITVFTTVITTGIYIAGNSGLEEAFRHSLFQTVAIATTTGFATTDYLQWNGFLWFLIFILMFTGGCMGSTGGGLKMIRVLVLIKNTRLELKRLLHPMAVVPLKIEKRNIPAAIVSNFLAFFLLYIMVFFFGASVMSMFGLDFETSIGASIASLGNIGPAIGGLGPADNYAFIPAGAKWVLSFLMLLGRLELFTVLLLLSPGFWKK